MHRGIWNICTFEKRVFFPSDLCFYITPIHIDGVQYSGSSYSVYSQSNWNTRWSLVFPFISPLHRGRGCKTRAFVSLRIDKSEITRESCVLFVGTKKYEHLRKRYIRGTENRLGVVRKIQGNWKLARECDLKIAGFFIFCPRF